MMKYSYITVYLFPSDIPIIILQLQVFYGNLPLTHKLRDIVHYMLM